MKLSENLKIISKNVSILTKVFPILFNNTNVSYEVLNDLFKSDITSFQDLLKNVTTLPKEDLENLAMNHDISKETLFYILNNFNLDISQIDFMKDSIDQLELEMRNYQYNYYKLFDHFIGDKNQYIPRP
jgi:hypothetical protein